MTGAHTASPLPAARAPRSKLQHKRSPEGIVVIISEVDIERVGVFQQYLPIFTGCLFGKVKHGLGSLPVIHAGVTATNAPLKYIVADNVLHEQRILFNTRAHDLSVERSQIHLVVIFVALVIVLDMDI
jgi:hypothetical protein